MSERDIITSRVGVMHDDWDSDLDGPKGYADAPREKWSLQDDYAGSPNALDSPSQWAEQLEASLNTISSLRDARRAVVPSSSWRMVQGSNLFTFEAETRSAVREERRRMPHHQRIGDNMLFTGLLCLLGFGIVSAVLCGEGANRLESVDLSPNAKAAG
ncbi:hypothetical protein CCHR01_14683 [Colletotrichum chrysophilum]|uniref:Uncharacterized protein n=1 Tax=Colletotrichum chrysophilum TaxID=1836956 RepID=A0AAD9A708_9PEZI|nr:hypothetical protein CCHR01_14683 [Colletotrichum chrysophilum]